MRRVHYRILRLDRLSVYRALNQCNTCNTTKHMKLITVFWLRIIRRYREIIWRYTAIWIGTIRRQWIYTSKWNQFQFHKKHYSDIMMSAMASQITGVSIVCLTFCWGAGQRKRQSYASLVPVRGIHRWPVVSSHGGAVTRKMLDDVIMYSVIEQK